MSSRPESPELCSTHRECYQLLHLDKDATRSDIEAALPATLERYNAHSESDDLNVLIRISYLILINPDTRKYYDDAQERQAEDRLTQSNDTSQEEASPLARDERVSCEACRRNAMDPCEMCLTCDGCKKDHIHKSYNARDCECPPKGGDEGVENPKRMSGADLDGDSERKDDKGGLPMGEDEVEDAGNDVGDNEGDGEGDEIRQEGLTRCRSTTSEHSNDDTEHSPKRVRIDHNTNDNGVHIDNINININVHDNANVNVNIDINVNVDDDNNNNHSSSTTTD